MPDPNFIVRKGAEVMQLVLPQYDSLSLHEIFEELKAWPDVLQYLPIENETTLFETRFTFINLLSLTNK